MDCRLIANHSRQGQRHADCTISPELSGQTYLRFSQARRLIAIGEHAGNAAIPTIRAGLAALP